MKLFNSSLRWSDTDGRLTSESHRILRTLLDAADKIAGPFQLPSYAVADVPLATDYEGALIYVSNETGGKTVAFSDGTNWRRVQDRAVIS